MKRRWLVESWLTDKSQIFTAESAEDAEDAETFSGANSALSLRSLRVDKFCQAIRVKSPIANRQSQGHILLIFYAGLSRTARTLAARLAISNGF